MLLVCCVWYKVISLYALLIQKITHIKNVVIKRKGINLFSHSIKLFVTSLYASELGDKPAQSIKCCLKIKLIRNNNTNKTIHTQGTVQ